MAPPELPTISRHDPTHRAEPLTEIRSRLDTGEPGSWYEAVMTDSDLLVQRPRPFVADLVGVGRVGIGTLLAPADPMIILGGSCYRLDAGMSASRVSLHEAVRCATVVDFRAPSTARIEHPVLGADVARLAAGVIGPLPRITAVELSGTFSYVTAPNAIFGRTDGTAVGFVTSTSAGHDWNLTFLTADRSFGGRVLELSIENVKLEIVAPRVVFQVATRERASAPPAIGSGR
jgi:alpha-acetolactate decarboxylase